MDRWRASLMPAKPRRLGVRRDRDADDFGDFARELDFDVARDRLADFFELERCDFVSPFSRRILFTVRAATSSARRP
jgi:hypothetical protein